MNLKDAVKSIINPHEDDVLKPPNLAKILIRNIFCVNIKDPRWCGTLILI